jgi:hypothetical protein
VGVDVAVDLGGVADRVVGVGDGVGLVPPDVVVEVQPAVAARATSTPVRTSAAGFTTQL